MQSINQIPTRWDYREMGTRLQRKKYQIRINIFHKIVLPSF